MKRQPASVLAVATSAAAVALSAFGGGSAFADDITIDNTPFTSSKARAEVQSELSTPYPAGNPWSTQYKQTPPRSSTTSQQVRNEYKMSREEVQALIAEDSGSAWLGRSPVRANAATTLGGPAR